MLSHSSVIGIDLGGTKISAARFVGEGLRMEGYRQIATRAAEGWPQVYETLVRLALELQTDDTVAVGLGVPGLVCQPAGVIWQLPNIPGADRFALKNSLADRLTLPVFVENDARCFTLAEASLGVGKNERVVVGITMGTGVGGGIVIDGRIMRGHHGFAGEIGHMLLHPGGLSDGATTLRGDTEQFLSGVALGKRAGKDKLPVHYLDDAVLRRDVIIKTAQLCASLTHVLDPSVIVFGGSAGRSLARYLAEIAAEMPHWLLPGTPLPSLSQASLPCAELLGAALLCHHL